ncbi:MAG: repeat-containing protein [Verrucomicrobiales bacterium]|nr:repeat-containing protein [Verrucomicrobiales bacterium]
MKNSTLRSKLLAAFACLALLFGFTHQAKALDGGIDPKNMGKGDWIWSVSISIAKLNNQVPGVTDVQSLMSYERNQGMNYVIVKAGTGSTNYPSQASPQFTANLVTQAHKVGLKIFAYTRSYGTDMAGEIAMATNCLALGADGWVIDAEAEWESSRLGTNGPSRAMQYGAALKAAYPTRLLGHAPMPYISLHSSFPYKEFGYYCDVVMPQCYWGYFGLTPEQTLADVDTEWRNWQNSLSGTWTNAIKPLLLIGQADNTNVLASEITAFANAVNADTNGATAGGYKSINWWDAHEHSSNHWPAIAAVTIGDAWGVPDVIVDNQAATMVGTWTLGTSSADKYAADYRSKGQGTGTASLTFTPTIVVPGDYKVYEWHPKGSNRTTNAPCILTYSGGTTNIKVNQTLTGGSWVLLGTFPFVAGTSANIKITDATPDAGQLIMADAVKFSYVIPVPPAPVGLNATASTGPLISLTWSDNATDEFDWIVSRGTNSGGPYTAIATLPAGSTAYTDSEVGATTTYYYAVRSENHGGYSAYSSEASATTDASVADIIVDNQSATVTGSWSIGTGSADKFGADYRFKSQGTGSASLLFTPEIFTPGDYKVFEWHPQGSNRTLGAPHIISYNGGSATLNVNQQGNGGKWNLLGTFNLASGQAASVRITDGFADAGQLVMADAIKFAYVPLVTAPLAPSGLSATAAGTSQINLSWTDNSSNEDNFVLSRSTTSGGPYSDVATLAANTTSYSNTGLSAGTTYYYVVRAVNTGGSSALSNQGSATTTVGAPSAPSGLSATTVSASQIDLSWTDNSGNETSFIVARSATSGGPYTDIVTLGANVTAYSNTGLSANTTYYYVVRSGNAGGASANSAQASATTLPNPPTAPSGLAAATVNATQIDLSWTDNSGNETSFVVARSETSGGAYTDIATLGANVAGYSDTGLTANTTYYYVVRASNIGGSSANTAEAAGTTLPNAPGVPSGLAASTISATQIDLSWTDNSSNETGFVVARSATSGGSYTDIVTLGVNVTSYSDTNLIANTAYYYVVRASNTGGDSANSVEGSATTLPNPPSAPSGLTALTISATQINLSWADNSSNETGFVVARSATSGGPYTDIVTLGVNATSYNDTGLTANTTYYYVVRASNTGGDSANDVQASATTLPNAPTAPSGLSASTVSASQIDLSWADNSSNETSFVVGRSASSGGPYNDIATLGANVTGYSDSGLIANTAYYYVVRASNTGGDSANSGQATATTLPLPPAAPSGLNASTVSATQLNLSWSDNSANETGFTVARSTVNGGPYSDIVTAAANATSYSDSGLTANTTYYYVVRASNTGGSSANSAQASATTLPNAPTAPSGLSASTVSASQINLSWADNSSNETAFIVARSATPGGPYNDIVTLGVNATGYSDTGLSANTAYYYVVRASNTGGDSANSGQGTATTLPLPPAAPSGLSASTVSATQIDLSWNDNSANETGFTVARSTVNGGPYSDIVTVAANATSYNNSGLTANTTYYYVVRASNTGGSSANSAQASATTLPLAPAAPSGLSAATISASQINLSWTDNSGNETSMIVARSTTSGGSYVDIATLAANTVAYNNTGLSANTTYYYVVRASNSGGASANSAEASATTLPLAPAAPSALAAVAISSTRIDLSWTDNSANETSFVLARSLTVGGPYTNIATLGANVTAYSDTGRATNTTYYYVVRASNSGGTSANSAEASATTFETDLLIDNVSAVVTGNWATGSSSTDKYGSNYRYIGSGSGANSLKYTPYVTSTGNYEVYEWHTQGGNRATNAPYVISYNGGNVTNLVNQKVGGGAWNLIGTYSFAAGNSGNIKITDGNTGTNIVIADALKLVALPVPNAPSGLTTTAISASQINLAWTDNSANETGFVVARSTTSGGPYTDIVTLAANTVSYNNTGLAEATTYYYVVRASGAGGSSANSAQASATTLVTIPSAPSGLTATAISASQINLAWTDNSTNETGFVVARSTTSGGPYTDIVTLAVNTVSYNNTGLTAATTYYYVVRASNAGGSSANSAQASATTLPTAPVAPSGLTATAISASQINLAWTDNSANETGFIVARSTTSGGLYTDIVTLAANTVGYNDTGLAATTTYYYVVRASNAGGSSANSAQASATTLVTIPSAPSGLTATTISTTQINLAWTDNSSNEANFVVARSTIAGGPYTDIVTLGANVISYSNTGLAPSTTYYYVVRASNAGGTSANSARASATTLSPAPAAPTGLIATTLSSSSIKLTWTDNSANEINFIVARSTISGGPYSDIATLGANIVSYTNTGLASSTTYYFVVRSSNGSGSSTNSTQASATTSVGAPAAPSGLIATALNGSQIKLTWTDNSANETGFIVARGTTSGGPYTDIATLAANTTVYTNSSLIPSTAYYYVVRSTNSGGASANSAQATATTTAVADIIIDNPSATVTGTWSSGTSSTDKFGTDYRFKSAGTGTAFLTFTPTIVTPGNYRIYEWHPQGANRPTNAPVVINYNGGSPTVTVNQQVNGGTWVLLTGTYNFLAGTTGTVKVTDNFIGAGLSVMADGIKFVYVP